MSRQSHTYKHVRPQMFCLWWFMVIRNMNEKCISLCGGKKKSTSNTMVTWSSMWWWWYNKLYAVCRKVFDSSYFGSCCRYCNVLAFKSVSLYAKQFQLQFRIQFFSRFLNFTTTNITGTHSKMNQIKQHKYPSFGVTFVEELLFKCARSSLSIYEHSLFDFNFCNLKHKKSKLKTLHFPKCNNTH